MSALSNPSALLSVSPSQNSAHVEILSRSADSEIIGTGITFILFGIACLQRYVHYYTFITEFVMTYDVDYTPSYLYFWKYALVIDVTCGSNPNLVMGQTQND